MIHFLKETKDGLYRARCGAEEKVKVASGMPSTFTGWETAVTCKDCRP